MRMIRQEMAELSKKLSLLTRSSLTGGGTGIFSKTKFFLRIIHNIYKSIHFFDADAESDLSFEPNRSFLTKHCLKKVPKCTKTASRNQIA
jgi:hypothetical protein